jgi:hypothetical protein
MVGDAMPRVQTTNEPPRRPLRPTNQQTSTTALSRQEYAMHIRAARRKSVESYVETGSWLNEAKRNLPHGEYGNMVKEDLGYSDGMARKLRKIATVFGPNRSIWNALPPCAMTLYQLALIPMPRLEALIEEGIVHAGITYEKACELANDESPRRPRRPQAQTVAVSRHVSQIDEPGTIYETRAQVEDRGRRGSAIRRCTRRCVRFEVSCATGSPRPCAKRVPDHPAMCRRCCTWKIGTAQIALRLAWRRGLL